MISLLQKMQVRADDYQLDIGSIIFEIMNLDDRKDTEELFKNYVEMSEPILKLSMNQFNKNLDRLASQVYYYLEQFCHQ